MSRKSSREQKHSNKKDKGKTKKPTQAALADRHVLYQESVQCVEAEIDFVDDTFKALRNRKAYRLREDFCGTANTSCEWIRRRSKNYAIGVDLDEEVLQWGQENNLSQLNGSEKRIELIRENVLNVDCDPVDIVLAMNFSYWILMERDTLRRYFKRVRESLVTDGIFFLDAYGGYDAFREMKERTKYEKFTYIWDQSTYDPISGRMQCYIHFKFPDGSRMKRAFSYEWRLWTLPEIRELLTEAGFANVTIYWQGADDDGEGNGEFEAVERGDADPAWIVYIVAEK